MHFVIMFFYRLKVSCLSIFCCMFISSTGADVRILYAFQVLFQNDSPATLLARVMGIIGSIEQAMLAQGRDTYKYFTRTTCCTREIRFVLFSVCSVDFNESLLLILTFKLAFSCDSGK